jgi:hypothetical protein
VSVGKRLRFEILKRDGFRCRYCGALAVSTLLHVDHVVPKAEGGTDVPENLIAACADCNLGKSDVPLSESRIASGPTTEDAMMHAEQIREYLAAHSERECATRELEEFVLEQYTDALGEPDMEFMRRLRWICANHSLDQIATAIAATQRNVRSAYPGPRGRYFGGVLRKLRGGEQ